MITFFGGWVTFDDKPIKLVVCGCELDTLKEVCKLEATQDTKDTQCYRLEIINATMRAEKICVDTRCLEELGVEKEKAIVRYALKECVQRNLEKFTNITRLTFSFAEPEKATKEQQKKFFERVALYRELGARIEVVENPQTHQLVASGYFEISRTQQQ